MKTVLMTLTAFALTFSSAQAAERRQLPKKQKTQFGSQCGLTDEYGSDEWTTFGRGWSLGEGNEDEIAALPTIIKQQLIITAKQSSEVDPGEIRTAMDAVHALREGSEAGDLEVSSFRYNGNDFTQVLTYGGGNPTGLIFVKDSRHAVAMIADSDVVCLVK